MFTGVSSAKKRSLEPVSSSLATLVERRWLIWHFVQHQLSRSYRNSFLGILWLLLSPVPARVEVPSPYQGRRDQTA